ncbi:MAG: hypothetical protein EA378_10540 [Phycisphaerales bacterium]|nr:MAG: hypothetical protein EA378_10540 [Phycisphaerales bacterium]
MPARVFGPDRIPTVDPRAAPPTGPNADPERDPRLRVELHPGERLVWAGYPVRTPMGGPRLIARAGGVFFALFSLLWIGMALGIGVFASSPGPGSGAGSGAGGFAIVAFIASAMGLVPLAIGVGLVVGSSKKRWAPHRFLYALTTDRCIIWTPTPLGSATVVSLTPDQLRNLQRHERADATGDLILARELRAAHTNPAASGQVGPMSHVTETAHAFLSVAEVAKVERLVRETFDLGTPVREF